MSQDGKEERRVEICDGSNESSGDSPHATLDPIGSIVDLSSILPPSICQQLVTVFGLDEGRVLNNDSREDGECVSDLVFSLLLHFEN